jgi:hypothetical protein
MNRSASLLFLLLLGSVAACDSSEDAAAESRVDSETDGPLYALATSYITGDDIETYLVTSKTFDETTKIDPKDGPKFRGGIDIVLHDGALFAPESNGAVLLRFGVDDRGKLKQNAELSFAGLGITEIVGKHLFVVDDDTGYVFDPKGPRLIVWNPKTMTLTGEEIDLPELAREGFTPKINLGLVNLGAVRSDNLLLIPAGWEDQDGNARYASGLLVIDAAKNELVAFDEDERCGEAYNSLAAPNGDIYFFPPAWSATQHYFVEEHQPTCILRVRPGETEFDSSYQLDLSNLGSGSAAAGAIPDGKTGFFFLSTDEELWDERDDDLYAFWRVWHYDFETEESRQIDSLPVWTGHAHYVDMAGLIAFVYWEETETGNRTTFYGVDGAKDPKRLFSYDASWYSFGRLR